MSGRRRTTREERRRAELDERRARRRGTRTATRNERSLLLPLTIGGLALGVVAIVVFMAVSAPPPGADLQEPLPANYALADGQALGSADAPVTLEVWSDFQCPACRVLANEVKPPLVRDYVEAGQARLVYRDFAFLGPESIDAAVAARCAAAQNRFWQFHDYLFANQGSENRGAFSAPRLQAIAQAVGLDVGQYQACVADPSQRQAVLDERSAAPSIDSTPTLIIDGEQRIVGVPDYAALRQVIDGRLAEGGLPR